MKNQIQELKLILQAIEQQRSMLRVLADRKLAELITAKQPSTDDEFAAVRRQALTSPDFIAEHEKLVNLYGLIGSQSSELIRALEAA